MKYPRLLILTIVIPIIFAQNQVTQDMLLKALEDNHPLWQRTELAQEITKLEKKSLTGSQDMNIKTDAAIRVIPQSSAMSSFDRTTSASASGEISKLYWKTGGTASAGVSLASSWMSGGTAMPSMPDNSFDNSIFVMFTQPLLKNYKGILYSLPWQLKDIEIDTDKLKRSEEREALLAESSAMFLDWAYYNEIEDILEKRKSLSEESLECNIRKRKSNLVDEVDVIRAQTSLKATELSIESNIMLRDALLVELEKTTGLTLLNDKSPAIDINILPELLPLDEIITDFLENSRTLGQIKKSIEMLVMSRTLKEEALKDNLSVYTRLGLQDSDPDFVEAILIDKTEIALGLTWQFPRNKTTEKANLEVLNLQIEELELQLEELELSYITSISKIYNQLESLQSILATIHEQLELAKSQTKEEERLYEIGRNEYTFVIQSQDKQENILQSYAQNVLSWQKLYNTLLSLTDKLYTE